MALLAEAAGHPAVSQRLAFGDLIVSVLYPGSGGGGHCSHTRYADVAENRLLHPSYLDFLEVYGGNSGTLFTVNLQSSAQAKLKGIRDRLYLLILPFASNN